jgi:hypothetical protein
MSASSGRLEQIKRRKLYPLKGQGFCANRDATRNASLVLTNLRTVVLRQLLRVLTRCG